MSSLLKPHNKVTGVTLLQLDLPSIDSDGLIYSVTLLTTHEGYKLFTKFKVDVRARN
jgi:hypothetical protein